MQIYENLRQQIIAGSLSPGTRLVSSRNYAIELGVSRTSVVAAFEQLQAEGYIVTRRGSGCYVAPAGSLDALQAVQSDQDSEQKETVWKQSGSDLQSGSADMRLFPYKTWARCVARVAREYPESLIQSSDAFGNRSLRESIVRYLFEWRGMSVSPAQVLITAGSIDALEICIRALLKPDDRVGLENPGYLPLRSFIQNIGLSPVWLPVSKDGVQLPAAAHKDDVPKLVVLTPSHQFPLGGAMSPGRRVEFLSWAEKADAWIIEDDYDSEFRYAGKPIPALSGYDRSGRSIYIGSFAKIFSTGLRLGFLVAPRERVGDIQQTLSRFASKASVSMQRALSDYMDSGDFYRHIRRVRRIYGERRKTLVECLRRELGELMRFENHQTGMLFATRLPDNYNDIAIARAAREENILVSALSTYYAGENKQRGLLISFCVYDNTEIIALVPKLKRIIEHNSTFQKTLAL